MQYILSQEEYDDLKNIKKKTIEMQEKKLQELCSKIANTMPAGVSWIGVDNPWNCVLTVDYEWYCDSCPVVDICPHPYKEWSK